MNIELRNDSVIISGYVNAVERLSKPIREKTNGKIRTFLEKIKSGVFKRALERNNDVQVLLNHNPERVLARTGDNSAKLEEDNIGLRAEVTIKDEEIISKAKNNELTGWSFGFYKNSEDVSSENGSEVRTVTDLDLIEVSILDNSKSPAYNGTSIESRDNNSQSMEIRSSEFYEREEEKSMEIDIDLLADKISELVIKKMEKSNSDNESAEKEKNKEDDEERSVDYSEFENRIKNIKAQTKNKKTEETND